MTSVVSLRAFANSVSVPLVVLFAGESSCLSLLIDALQRKHGVTDLFDASARDETATWIAATTPRRLSAATPGNGKLGSGHLGSGMNAGG
jgi:hypothetical protein